MEGIKGFLNRNKSIFGAGFVMLVIFLVIIGLSAKRGHETPEFVEITSDEKENALDLNIFNIGKNDAEENSDESADIVSIEGLDQANKNTVVSRMPANTLPEPEKPYSSEDLTPEEFDERYGAKEIAYTENGFSPRNTKAIKGQIVKWINFTDQDIYIKQKVKKFDEFSEPVRVPAGGEFQFRLTDDKLWTYEEVGTEAFGSIFIVKAALE